MKNKQILMIMKNCEKAAGILSSTGKLITSEAIEKNYGESIDGKENGGYPSQPGTGQTPFPACRS